MTKPDWITQCHAYFEDQLSPEQRRTFLVRLAQDAEFQRVFQQFEQVHHSLPQAVEVSLPEGLETRVLEAVQHAQSRPQRSVIISGRWTWALSTAAGLLLVACAGTMMSQLWHTPDVPTTALQHDDAWLEVAIAEVWTDVDTLSQGMTTSELGDFDSLSP